MILNNYHTHSNFCDGSDEPEKYVEEAIRLGLISLGFSGHAPVPFENTWSIKKENLGDYCRTIEGLKGKYAGKINIFLGLEIDYIPGISTGFGQLFADYRLDYAIGSVHLVKPDNKKELWFIDGPEKGYISGLKTVFENDIRVAVNNYYHQICEMVSTQRPDIIGHLDKIKMHNKDRFFHEEEDWYKEIVNTTLKFISGTKTIVEVNTRGIYKHKTNSLFPSVSILEQCCKLKIPVTISSDTHSPGELVNYFDEARQLLKDIGYKKVSYFTGTSWKNQLI